MFSSDQHERAMVHLKAVMVVKGSMSQIRVNPLADYIAKLESVILRLEVELGLTPMSRLRLGIRVGEAMMTFEEMNRRFVEPEDAETPDARLTLVSAKTSQRSSKVSR